MATPIAPAPNVKVSPNTDFNPPEDLVHLGNDSKITPKDLNAYIEKHQDFGRREIQYLLGLLNTCPVTLPKFTRDATKLILQRQGNLAVQDDAFAGVVSPINDNGQRLTGPELKALIHSDNKVQKFERAINALADQSPSREGDRLVIENRKGQRLFTAQGDNVGREQLAAVLASRVPAKSVLVNNEAKAAETVKSYLGRMRTSDESKDWFPSLEATLKAELGEPKDFVPKYTGDSPALEKQRLGELITAIGTDDSSAQTQALSDMFEANNRKTLLALGYDPTSPKNYAVLVRWAAEFWRGQLDGPNAALVPRANEAMAGLWKKYAEGDPPVQLRKLVAELR